MKFFYIIISLLLILPCFAEDSLFHIFSDEPHEIRIIDDGYDALETRLEMINRANKSIDMEYFIFNNDKSGQLVLQTLMNKAKQGVKIRILIDDNLLGKPVNIYIGHILKLNNIDIKLFNTSGPLSFKGQYRTHRKLLIIDGKEFMTGGRNIADEYFGFNKKVNFVDRDIWVKGPLVINILKTFDEFWNFKWSEDYNELPKATLISERGHEVGNNTNVLTKEDIKRNLDQARDFIFNTEISDNFKILLKEKLTGENKTVSHICNNIEFLSDAPGKKGRLFSDRLFNKIQMAESNVQIETAYFVLQDNQEKIFQNVLNKGVNIDLLTNSYYSNNHKIVSVVADRQIPRFLSLGMKASLFKGEALASQPFDDKLWVIHTKSVVLDNKISMIGTYNFDPRSFSYNAEDAIFCNDNAEFAKELSESIEIRKKNSVALDLEKKNWYLTEKVEFFSRIVYFLSFIPSFFMTEML